MTDAAPAKAVTHVAARFYRANAIDLALVPLLEETAPYARGAGDGYFLVVLLGEPGTAYPLDLGSPGALDTEYLAEKFHLDRRGYGYTPEELSVALREVAADLVGEGSLGLMTTLLIDNYDSFTYNLYQYLSELGAEIVVHRNDKVTVEECEALQPDRVVISPGPGRPSGAGVSTEVVRRLAGNVPVLGVCLGHQCISEAFGGEIVGAGEIKHGKTSTISHDGRGVFAGLPDPFTAVRYHSLAANPAELPDSLTVSARSESGVIMGVRHERFTVEGVQFHPESIATEHGKELLQNFLDLRGGTWDR